MTQDKNIVQCPAKGCDFEGPNAKQHWGGKRDDAHSGSFYEALNSTNQNTTNEPNEPDGPVGKDPVMGGGDTSNVGTSDDVELPCSHESFNPDEAPEPPYEVSCSTCGESWTVSKE